MSGPLQILLLLSLCGENAARTSAHALHTGCTRILDFTFGLLPMTHLTSLNIPISAPTIIPKPIRVQREGAKQNPPVSSVASNGNPSPNTSSGED